MTVSTGIITTIAGTGSSGYSGDNGQATSAALWSPAGVALYSSGIVGYLHYCILTLLLSSLSLGNVYIADSKNHRIRKVTVSTGIITTIAGTGTSSYSGDNGAATSAALRYPTGVALDTAGIFYHICYIQPTSFSNSLGNVYIADVSNNRIRKVTVSTGIITTLAGTATCSYSGDNGQATSAGLCNPFGLALDTAGKSYFIYLLSLSSSINRIVRSSTR